MYDRALGTLGAAGGGLLGAMGRALEPLDWARQSAWNVPGKLAEGDFAAALPGLMGLGAGGLAAATGFGIPAAIGIGSLVGGGLQGIGLQSNPEAFRAPTPEDVTGSDNWLLNALVGAVGDPLTYAGGFGGRRAGAKAGAYLDDLGGRPLPAVLGGQVDNASAVNPFALVDNPPPGLMAPDVPPPGWSDISAATGPQTTSAMGDPFYSRLQRALEEDPAKMYKTAGLEKRLLAGKIGGQGPINPDEINYAALPDLLSGSPTISKSELLRALQQQSLGVERTVLVDSPFDASSNAAKWAEYQSPGGENYRETLLRLPEGMTTTPYQSPHFDEPNILAHLRTNERTLPTGERMLHAEEIQSDWHQAGKKHGYQSPGLRESLQQEADDIAAQLAQMNVNATRDIPLRDAARFDEVRQAVSSTPEWQALWSRGRAIDDELQSVAGRVPDAPFKDAWPDLALKQLLHDAAKGNFDRVGWNSGEATQGLVGGGLPGQQQFYDQALPAKANKLLKALGVEGGVEPVLQPKTLQSDVFRASAATNNAIEDAFEAGLLRNSEGLGEYPVMRLQEMANAQVRGGPAVDWSQYGLDPIMMNNLAGTTPQNYLAGHQLRMTPELRAAILKGLPLLSLGGAGAGGGALLAALMNEGA